MIISVKKRVKHGGWLFMNILYHTGSKNPLNGICSRQERFSRSGLEKIGFDRLREIDGTFWIISADFFQCIDPILSQWGSPASIMYIPLFVELIGKPNLMS